MPRTRHQYKLTSSVVIALGLGLLLTWPTWTAVRNGLSDIYARPAIDYLEYQRFDSYLVSETEWQAIENAVAKANNLMPGNPQYLHALGWLHQLKLALFADELSIEEMDFNATAARDFFQLAVDSRPTWPYYWGNLALEYYRRGNYASDEFSLTLANASRFGPWKNDTQRLVADLGSDTWEFLSPQARQEYILNIERGLHRQPENTIQIVNSYSAWPKVCQAQSMLLDIMPHLQALCAEDRFAEPSPAKGARQEF